MYNSLFISILSPYAHLIFGTVFVVFVIGTLLVVILDGLLPELRSVYMACFICSVLIVTLIGMPVFPFVDMHKFSSPAEEEGTIYEIRVADSHGNELRYDTRAVPPVMGSRASGLGSDLINTYNNAERLVLGEFLISNAQEYRLSVESGESSRSALAPPRYVQEAKWTEDDLETMGELKEIRVYRIDMVFSEDSTEFAERDETLKLVIDPNAGEVHEI